MNPLKVHSGLLQRHADLIEDIYRSKAVAAEEGTDRALASLEAARIVICDDDGTYRLHPRERRYLDNIYDRSRLFEAGTPISVEMDRIREILIAINRAGMSGDDAKHTDYTDEAVDTILSLKVEIDRQIRTFDMTTRNGYHEASSLDEKMQKNAFYQGRAAELVNAVSNLNAPAMRDLFQGAYLTLVRHRYQKDILSRIETWSTRLEGVIREMLEFMYRIKAIEARTKRLRAIFHALESVPAIDMVEAIETSDVNLIPVNLKTAIRFDVRSEENEAQIIQVASKLDPEGTKGVRRMKHAAGVVRDNVALPEEETDPQEMILVTIFAHVKSSADPVSVRDWAAQNGVSNTDQLVMDVFDHMAEGEDGVLMSPHPQMSPYYTHAVTDVILSRHE